MYLNKIDSFELLNNLTIQKKISIRCCKNIDKFTIFYLERQKISINISDYKLSPRTNFLLNDGIYCINKTWVITTDGNVFSIRKFDYKNDNRKFIQKPRIILNKLEYENIKSLWNKYQISNKLFPVFDTTLLKNTYNYWSIRKEKRKWFKLFK